ncbi:MAG: SH3 domain-containing protein [Lachnospiraceae bacterium]|nr:SH3 domain-containing protein [Lachnospiraceae bacterium]
MKKRSVKSVILLLACIAALTLSAAGVSAAVYRKTTSSVNLRTKAGSTSSDTIITTIPKGVTVTLVGKSTKYSNWYYIEYNGQQGFVEGTYLTTTSSSTDSDDDDDEPTSSYTRYLTANVNLRSSAKINSSNIITTVAKGTKVTVYSQTSSGWYYVSIPSGTKGYMKSGYFSSTQPSTSSSAKKTTANLRLRSSAKIVSTNIITTIPKGSTVYVQREATGNWVYVRYGSTYGYVDSTYLTSSSSSSTSASTKKTTANVRLRSSRSTSGTSNIITVIPKGTTVTVTGTYTGWYKVSYSGESGYVSSDYLS